MHKHHGSVIRAMTIAGSDSGGGAGIQADLKTFATHGIFGTSVLTAVTAQNTLGVQDAHYLPTSLVEAQLHSVWNDIGVHAVKTGMLGSVEIIEVVSAQLANRRSAPLVVDPVMVAKGGHPLLDATAVESVKTKLLPLADIVTPNIPEAETLCGFEVHDLKTAKRAAELIGSMGAKTVVLKGGHANWAWDTLPTEDAAVDLVYDGMNWTAFATPRIPSVKTHGTGCTYSAAMTAGLAMGSSPLQSIAAGKAFVHRAIQSASDWDVGSGHGPTDHSVSILESPNVQSGHLYWWDGVKWIAWGGQV